VSNGRWVSPFNGTNWILAKQFASGQLDLWFEPYQVPTRFDVTVTYADGTTDSVTGIAYGLSTTPPSTSTPTTSPSSTPTPGPGTVAVLPGQPLPLRQWVERPMPKTARITSYMQTGGKHGRAFYHPGIKSMVFAGGDWHTTQPQYEGYGNAVGSEIWALDVANNKWTLQRRFCVTGAIQPGYPDNVVWTFDSKRNRGLMAPGFYAITQGAASTCGSINGYGAYAFDFVTKQFTGPDVAAGLPAPPGGWGGDLGASYGVYDPVADELVRVRNTVGLERLNLTTGAWRVQRLAKAGDPGWNPVPNRAQPVIDVTGRALYWIDAWGSTSPTLVKVNLTDASVTTLPLPSQYKRPASGDQEVYLAFDHVNRVIFVPNNYDMGVSPLTGLAMFHVDTGQWEWEAVPAPVTGSVWGFDQATGAMIGIGKRSQPYAYFLYSYSATRQPTR
jgi:hypothetical protein